MFQPCMIAGTYSEEFVLRLCMLGAFEHYMGKQQKPIKHHTEESQEASPFQQATKRLQGTDKTA